MAKKVNFIGDTLNGWNTDFWPEDYSFDMAVIAEQHPVREAELNIMQQNEWLKLRDHIRRLITDGWTLLGPYSFPGNADNSFLMAESWVNASGQSLHVGNPANSGKSAKIQLAAPPAGSGTRIDFVYLEAYLVEVAAPQSLDMGGTNVTDRNLYTWGGTANATLADQTWWTAASQETARRIQIRWTLRVVQLASGTTPSLTGVAAQAAAGSATALTYSPLAGSQALWVAGTGDLSDAQALGVVDGVVFATPVCAVARTGGQAIIASGSVTDLRIPVTLQPGILVPPGNLVPPPSVDPQLLHLGPTHIIYTGIELAGYTPPTAQGAASATLHSHTAAYATRLLLPPNAQPIAFLNAGGTESAFVQSSTALTRVAVLLTKSGAGGPVTIEIHSDATTVPGGTIYASATIPASWLTTAPRIVSFPVPTIALSPASAIWVVVKKGGTGSNEALLLANAQTDANAAAAQASDGVSWTASGALPFQCAIFSGTDGNIVHVTSEDMTEIMLYEYDANDNPIALGEYYTGSSAEYDAYRLCYYNSDGTLIDIV
jgi:hypothetical protein